MTTETEDALRAEDATTAVPEGAGSVTVDEIVALATVTGLALSPDGATVAYVLGTASREGEFPTGQIYLLSTEGADTPKPRRFTCGAGLDSTPRWSPDGTALAFISDREKPGRSQLYVIDLSGGEARRLTDEKGGVSDPRWAPDGSALAYIAAEAPSDAEEQRKKERDDAYVASREIKRQRLWTVRRDGSGASLLSHADRHVWAHMWSPAGDHVAAITSATPDWNENFRDVLLTVYPLAGDEAPRDLGPVPFSAWYGITWSRDGETLFTLGSSADDFPETYLRAWPLAGAGAVTPRALLRDLPGSPTWLGRPSDGDDLFLLVIEGAHAALYRASADGARAEKLPAPGLEQGVSAEMSLSADGRRVVMTRSDSTHANDLWVWDAGGGLRRVLEANPWLNEKRLGRQEVIRWTSFDGREIEGLLITPPDYQEGRRYPLVVAVHGGPAGVWTDHCYLNWHDWAQYLAAAGLLVLLPNPRGSSGYGNRFVRANVGDIGGGDYRDLMAGVDYLVDQGLADPERLGIGGWSYGGTLTPWTLTQTDRFRCAVMGAGICNWVSFSGTCDIRIFGDVLFDAEMNKDALPLWQRSALSRVDRVRTPTLIVHGEADVRVPVSQGREFYTALRHQDVPTELVTYPREGHIFAERHHQRDLLVRVRDWFTRHLLNDGRA